ncbi:MAG: hypothetical protein L0I24_15985 [Pseudonocardia sp.]|nr:hypothetical protein [Pseudonocardia sp.]
MPAIPATGGTEGARATPGPLPDGVYWAGPHGRIVTMPAAGRRRGDIAEMDRLLPLQRDLIDG